MLKIYGTYRSRAVRNVWLAEELGIPYELVPVLQAYRLAKPDAPDAPLNTRSPGFLEINPSGQVPSIVDGDLVLHESLAINLYLARKHGGPLAARTPAEDGQLLQWTLWAATAVEPHANQILAHRAMRPEAERDPAIANAAIEALRGPFHVLDGALAATGTLVGGRFTVADVNVAETVRYCLFAPELFGPAPRVKAWLDACHARAAFKAMWAKREQEPPSY